jgi:phosphoglycolate phosphatase-like HAD superfamily hydrolase
MNEIEFQVVVLFDIDGTLLTSSTGGRTAGFAAMNRTSEEFTGRALYGNPLDFAGRTDVQISRALLQAGGVAEPSAQQVERFVARYVELLHEEIPVQPYAVLGNPGEAVAALRSAGAIAGLGTGNVRRGGALKLASAGIGDLFDMDQGGYGDDGDTRAELLSVGAKRCDPSRRLPLVVVGDTPFDIAAAHEIGARAVGVPFRKNTEQVLSEAGADAIVPAVDRSLVQVIADLLT